VVGRPRQHNVVKDALFYLTPDGERRKTMEEGTKNLTIRLTDEEYTLLETLSKKTMRSKNNILRMLIRLAVIEELPQKKVEDDGSH
jgi:hypothetical protein